ncbi:unnamed protein product [Diamesa serratosioi]
MMLVVVVVAEDASAECSENSCIVSNSFVTDSHFNEIIDETSYSVVALKFVSCYMDLLPLNVFVKLPSLLYLTISSPGVRHFGQNAFEKAVHLELLNAAGNRLSKLEHFAFKGASNLSELNLSGNKIQTIEKNAFAELEHLKVLNLSKNKMSYFGPETFAPLIMLDSLDISHNMIDFLDAKLFYNNLQLNDINASENNVEKVTNGFIQLLPQIQDLNMMKNPCINNTLMEFFPYVKTSGRGRVIDEKSLKKCYENYMKTVDPESMDLDMDLDSLMNHVEIVRDDIEINIIAEQNEDLRERDSSIKDLNRRDDLITILLLLGFVGICFYMVVSIIIKTVNDEYMKQLDKKKGAKDTAMELIPKKNNIIYTINI